MLGKIKLVGFLIFGGFVAYTLLTDSGSSSSNVVDLDVVLDKFIETMDELDGAAEGAAATAAAPADNVEEDPEKTGQILSLYHSKINAAQLQTTPIGIVTRADGAILGFDDKDGDNAKAASGEKDLFSVEIDAERSRLIATDLEHGYARDGRFRVGGLVAGYFLGRMLTGQRAAGVSSSKFANVKTQPRGYHKSAQSAVRARSGGGSRSFSSGK